MMSNEKKQKNNRTKNICLSLAIVFIVALGASAYWYMQIFKYADQIRTDKQVYNQELKDAQFITEIKKEKQQAEEIQTFLDTLYVEEGNAVTFIEHLEGLAVDVGASLDINNFGFKGKEDEQKDVVVSMKAFGSWNQINRFLVAVENSSYHLIIDELTLSVNRDDQGPSWVASFELKGLTK